MFSLWHTQPDTNASCQPSASVLASRQGGEEHGQYRVLHSREQPHALLQTCVQDVGAGWMVGCFAKCTSKQTTLVAGSVV